MSNPLASLYWRLRSRAFGFRAHQTYVKPGSCNCRDCRHVRADRE